MSGQARLRAERAARLRVRQRQARSLRGLLQRPDAGAFGTLQARARDDRGRRVLAEPLLLLPHRAWRSGAGLFGRPGARRNDGDELPRRKAHQKAARHARFRRENHQRFVGDRGGRPRGTASRWLFRPRHLGHRRGRGILQHVEQGRERDRHASERGVSRAGTVATAAAMRFFLAAGLAVWAPSVTLCVAQTAPPAQAPILTSTARFLPVVARNGMVVSQEKRATHIGVEILKAGGNAIDAAVAVGFALAVTHPQAGNIGGGGFMLVHLAGRNETIAIDYRETAPAALTRDAFLDEKGEVDPK